MKFLFSLLALLSMIIISPRSALAQDKPCEALRSDLQQKNLRLSEYLDTLKKFDRRKEPEIVDLLQDKIGKLRQQIFQSEKELAVCEGQRTPGAPEGLGPIKSEEGEHATKNCGDLRKRLVVLVRIVHTLRRRESSLLSELTIAEKKELAESSEELKSVREALKTRCSAPPAPKPFRRQPKPPRGN
jgi:hypothetical protein